MVATKIGRAFRSHIYLKDDDPRSHGIKSLGDIWEKPAYVVPSPEWARARNQWVHGIGHQETRFGNLQQFLVAGVSPVHVSSGSPEFLDAANLVSDRRGSGGARLNIAEPPPGIGSGFSGVQVGDFKSMVRLGGGHYISGNTVALEGGTNPFRSMVEAAATDLAGLANMLGLGAYLAPLRRFVSLGSSWALVGRVEDDHGVPNVISLKESSGTGSLSISVLIDYASRIQELRSFGEEEDISVSRDSQSDFWRFMIQFPSEEPGHLMLMQDGHLRWIWKGNDQAHVGIRFIGSGRGRYVIFKRRAGEFQISRVSGEDNLEGVVQQVKSFDMTLFGNDRNQED